MGMTLCFCGQKGGTGKTTTALCVASEFLARRRSVLVVDTDPQRSAQTAVGIGAANGDNVPVAIAMGEELHRPGQLDVLAAAYDVVVIDCPSRQDDRAGAVTRAALMYCGSESGLAILPCGPSAMDVWALSDSIDAVHVVRTMHPDLDARIAITRKSPTRTVLGDSARSILGETGLGLFATELHHRIAYQEAPSVGLGVAQYQPKSPAAAEVISLVSEIEGVFDAR